MTVGLSSGLMKKGKEQYDILKPTIERKYWGQYIVIEPISHEYFINVRLADALREAKNKFPDREFFSARIGFEIALSLVACCGV
uniref:Uncharacterized protein n=1 Tax=viral metagenome TaxID=1070528 RepID=A0A6M3IJI0_9ZZZZ